MDTQEIVARLNSGSLADQIAALDVRLSEPSSFEPNERKLIAAAALDALRRSSDRYILAEKLVQLGDELNQSVIASFEQEEDSELKFYFAAILLLGGISVGVPALLSEVRLDGVNLSLASNLLAKAGVQELSPRLIEVLSKVPLGERTEIPTEQNDFVCTLLRCLAKIEDQFPHQLIPRFTIASTPVEIRNTVLQLWPQP